MKILIKTVFILLILCLQLILSSCSLKEVVSSQEENSQNNSSKSTYQVLTEKEWAEIDAFIDSIQPEYNYEFSGILYEHEKEEANQLVSIGIKGVPVLMTKPENVDSNDEDRRYKRGFYAECLGAILRVDRLSIGAIMSDYDNGIVFAGWEKECWAGYYRYVNTKAPEIIASEKDTAEKIEELKRFGMLALPYVVDEIEKGENEYKNFFTAIGLHLSVPDFMSCFGDHNISEEERYEKILTAEGAEDFDYKQWLSENEEDLNAMFKFLDEYSKQ